MSEPIAPLVLFDLDGTLLDSARDLHAAMAVLLAEKGEPPVDFEVFRPVVSKGARAMLKRSFAGADEQQREARRQRAQQATAVGRALRGGIGEVVGGGQVHHRTLAPGQPAFKGTARRRGPERRRGGLAAAPSL